MAREEREFGIKTAIVGSASPFEQEQPPPGNDSQSYIDFSFLKDIPFFRLFFVIAIIGFMVVGFYGHMNELLEVFLYGGFLVFALVVGFILRVIEPKFPVEEDIREETEDVSHEISQIFEEVPPTK